MSYTWEGLDILTPMTIRSNQTVWTVEKIDKSIDRLSHPSQRWEITFSVMTDNKGHLAFKALTGEFDKKGQIIMPTIMGSDTFDNKPLTDKVLANRAHTSGSTNIRVKHTHTSTKKVGVGAFVQFSNHTKMYSLMSAKTLGGNSADTTLNIFPSLRKAVPLDTKVRFYDDVNLHYWVDDSVIRGINFYDGILSGIDAITLLEAV